MTASGDFETVAWVYSQSETAVLLSRLADEDIYVLPVSRHHASADYPITLGLGGTEIRVHRRKPSGRGSCSRGSTARRSRAVFSATIAGSTASSC